MVNYLGTEGDHILKHPLVQSLLDRAKINKIKLDYVLDFSIVKKFKTDGRFIIAGYASVEVIDTQNELIPIETLKDSFSRFMAAEDYALSSIMHSNIPIAKILKEYTDSEGTVWKSHVNDDGLFIVAEVRQDIKKGVQTCELIDKGVLTGFSIGGEALATSTVCEGPTGSSCYTKIDKLDIHEIAIVDRPANQPSVFTIVKRYEPMLKVWEETDEYIRSGHGKKKEGMVCRTTDFEGKMPRGIKAVRCHMPDSDEWWTQSFLFPKDKDWTMSEAKGWFKEHKEKTKISKSLTEASIKEKLIDAFKRREVIQDKRNVLWAKQLQPEGIKELEREQSLISAEISALEKVLGEIMIKGPEESVKVLTGEQPEGDEETEKMDPMEELNKVMKGPVDRLGFKVLLLRAEAITKSKRVGGVGSSKV